MAANLEASNLFDVAGRWIAVTGAASGIGRMLARGFTANGAHTILIDVNESGLKQTKADLESLSRDTTVSIVCGDLQSEAGVQAVVAQVRAALPSATTPLDTLVHCAGIRHMNAVSFCPATDSLPQLAAATQSAPYAGWEQTFRVNVLAPYFLTAGLVEQLGAAAALGAGRGSVILFSSPASVHNHQFVPCYQTSKAAVDHLTRILAMEFAKFYIRVNAISPGIVPSGMTTSDPTSNLHLAAATPAKRAGSEEDMVGTALWLASAAGAFMDGKVVRVEGGRLLVLKGVTGNGDD